MGKILCATRGGEASYRTQDAAIAMARERGDDLLFLFVVDTHFLDKTSAPVLVDAGGELAQMGKFLLLMAQERAQKQGVAAQTLVCHGEIKEEIKRVVREQGVTTVILGRPAGETNIFGQEALEAFAREIEAETGAQAILI